jgi:hypothetical protein
MNERLEREKKNTGTGLDRLTRGSRRRKDEGTSQYNRCLALIHYEIMFRRRLAQFDQEE